MVGLPTPALLLVAAALFQAVASFDLQARQSQDPPPQMLTIPLVIEQDGRYSVQVNMTSNGLQRLNLAITTSTGYTVVAGGGCTGCGESVKSYNPTAGASNSTSPARNVTLAGGNNAWGPLLKENCTLLQQNGNSWAYPNQTIVVANSSSSDFLNIQSTASGIFGLGTNARDQNFADTVFGGWLRRNPNRTEFTYGMALKPRPASIVDPNPQQGFPSNDGGELHWLSPNSDAYTGEVSWKPISFDRTPDLDSDWTVLMDGYTVSNKATKVDVSRTSATDTLIAVLDPLYEGIIFPSGVARTIYASIEGALELSPPNSPFSVYTLPCSTDLTLTLAFGGSSTTIGQDVLVKRRANGKCEGAIQAWTDQRKTNTFLLGSDFISSVYLIFKIANDKSGQVGFAERRRLATENKRLRTAAIAGISVGTVAVILLLALISYILVKRRMKKKEQAKQLEKATPFPVSPGSPNETAGLLHTAGGPNTISSWSAGPGRTPRTAAPEPQVVTGVWTPSSANHGSAFHHGGSPQQFVGENGTTYILSPREGILSPPPPAYHRENDSEIGGQVLTFPSRSRTNVVVGEPPDEKRRRRPGVVN